MVSDVDGVWGNHIELRIPATSEFVGSVRSLTTFLAAKCGLTLDDIEDLQIAVDEACALLLPHARPGAGITARFALARSWFEVSVSVPADADAQPDRSTFSWSALVGMTDRVSVTHDGELAICLAKQRELARPV